jgi:hypothetical protein
VVDRARAARGTWREADALAECRHLLELHMSAESVIAEYLPPGAAHTARAMSAARRRTLDELDAMETGKALDRATLILAAPGITSEGMRECLPSGRP